MAIQREEAPKTSHPNERWAMDFMHDALANGRTLRVFAAVDVHTRECVALRAGKTFKGEDVAGILSEAGAERTALPDVISVDQGTEFTSRSLDHWAYWNRVRLDLSRPGKPTDNAFAEAFNSVLRRECLSQHYFIDEGDAQRILDRWRADYNNFRPHGSLARSTPADFAAGALQTQGPRELEKSHFP
jgi:putative transposase